LHTRRHTLFLVAALAGTLALAMPVGLSLAWSYGWAFEDEREALLNVAKATTRRAHALVATAAETLRHIDSFPGNACTSGNITRMRGSILSTRIIDEVGVYRIGQMQCNAWGHVPSPMCATAADVPVDARLRMATDCYPDGYPNLRMIGVFTDQLYAFIEPGRFTEVPVEDDIAIALRLTDGKTIAVLDALASSATVSPDGRLQVIWEEGAFQAAVSSPARRIAAQAERSALLLLPLVLVSSMGMLVGIVFWLRRRLSLLGELRAALAGRRLCVHYQPIVELASGRCTGAEALVRWLHEERGWVPAQVFVSLAERHGLASDITSVVICSVMAEMGAALRADRAMHVAINLSPQDLRNERIFALLAEQIRINDIAPRQIWLEVTERGFINAADVNAVLARSRAAGHAVAIDDFGTGYSSLSYLQTLPLDVLKVDKSFVDPIGSDVLSATVIDHIIDMARSLRLHIVAEGIESAVQSDYLRVRGVQFGQGWLFAQAMPAAQFLAFCGARRTQ